MALAHLASRSPQVSYTRRESRPGNSMHKPRTSNSLLILLTPCCSRAASCCGVSSHGLVGLVCSSCRRSHDTAVSCNKTSARSGGCARGPRFEFEPAHGLNPSSRQADSNKQLEDMPDELASMHLSMGCGKVLPVRMYFFTG